MSKKSKAVIAVCFLSTLLTAGCVTNSVKKNESNSHMLTYWIRNNGNITSLNMDFNDTPFARTLNEKTGINVKYIVQPDSDVEGRVELMLASSNMPDMIDCDGNSISSSGKILKMINDGYFIRLNELIEKNSPNFFKLIEENPLLKEEMSLYDGSYYNYPMVRRNKMLNNTYGLMLRKDWLDELGLEVPETINEWETVLRLFKEKKHASSPLNILPSCRGFMGAYGIIDDFYRNDFTIKFGYIEDGYKEYLSLMHHWYTEGLLESEYGNCTSQSIGDAVCKNRTGAIASFAGSGMGQLTEKMKSDGGSFKLIAAPVPTLEKGKIPEFGMVDKNNQTSVTMITRQCEHPEIAARYLDYGYSPEGHLLFNFGIEGESYILKSGNPIYTDVIKNNSDGLSFGQALAMYARASYFGPFEQDSKYLNQYYELPEQREAMIVWSTADEDRHALPHLTYPGEENDEFAGIMLPIIKYANEMSLKFILGAESLDNFDEYVSEIKKMNIDRAIEIQNMAYIRYRNK